MTHELERLEANPTQQLVESLRLEATNYDGLDQKNVDSLASLLERAGLGESEIWSLAGKIDVSADNLTQRPENVAGLRTDTNLSLLDTPENVTETTGNNPDKYTVTRIDGTRGDSRTQTEVRGWKITWDGAKTDYDGWSNDGVSHSHRQTQTRMITTEIDDINNDIKDDLNVGEAAAQEIVAKAIDAAPTAFARGLLDDLLEQQSANKYNSLEVAARVISSLARRQGGTKHEKLAGAIYGVLVDSLVKDPEFIADIVNRAAEVGASQRDRGNREPDTIRRIFRSEQREDGTKHPETVVYQGTQAQSLGIIPGKAGTSESDSFDGPVMQLDLTRNPDTGLVDISFAGVTQKVEESHQVVDVCRKMGLDAGWMASQLGHNNPYTWYLNNIDSSELANSLVEGSPFAGVSGFEPGTTVLVYEGQSDAPEIAEEIVDGQRIVSVIYPSGSARDTDGERTMPQSAEHAIEIKITDDGFEVIGSDDPKLADQATLTTVTNKPAAFALAGEDHDGYKVMTNEELREAKKLADDSFNKFEAETRKVSRLKRITRALGSVSTRRKR